MCPTPATSGGLNVDVSAAAANGDTGGDCLLLVGRRDSLRRVKKKRDAGVAVFSFFQTEL